MYIDGHQDIMDLFTLTCRSLPTLPCGDDIDYLCQLTPPINIGSIPVAGRDCPSK